MPVQNAPSLYALLVGINDYPHLPLERQLLGPKNDVQKIENYLKQDYCLNQLSNQYIHKLVSPAATESELPSKANIVKGFTEFLSQAQAGDTVLFYYSGHGVREETDIQIFQQEEIDGHITNITAYDFQITSPLIPQGEALLSDKELRYLIRQLSHDEKGALKVHVVTIFDCCHSGEGTRSKQEEAEDEVRVRQISRRALPGRNKEEFIFWKDAQIPEKIDHAQQVQEVLPLGDHVMIAACREVELAWERRGKDLLFGGVFTGALLDVLQAYKGQISYHHLHQRVLNRMRFFYFEDKEQNDLRQTPQLYIQALSLQARYHSFLTNTFLEEYDAPIDFMPKEQEWRLGLGAMHGVSPNQTEQPNRLKVKDLSDLSSSHELKIKTVFPTHSLVVWPVEITPNESKTYTASVDGIAIPPLAVYIDGEPEGCELARKGLSEILKTSKSKWFYFVEQELEADFVLYAQQNAWFTFLPFDRRPLLLPISYFEDGMPSIRKAYTAFKDFEQMAKWHYLKNLNYSASGLSSSSNSNYPIELRVFRQLSNGEEIRLYPQQGQFCIHLTESEPTWNLRFELLNHSQDILPCSLAYMSYHFGFSSNGIMMKPQNGLPSGETFHSKKTKDSDYIPVSITSYSEAFHWPREDNFLKLIYSKAPLALESFDMPGILRPGDNPDNYRSRQKDQPPVEPFPNWEIRTYGFSVVNPFFNPAEAQAKASTLPSLLPDI